MIGKATAFDLFCSAQIQSFLSTVHGRIVFFSTVDPLQPEYLQRPFLLKDLWDTTLMWSRNLNCAFHSQCAHRKNRDYLLYCNYYTGWWNENNTILHQDCHSSAIFESTTCFQSPQSCSRIRLLFILFYLYLVSLPHASSGWDEIMEI